MVATVYLILLQPVYLSFKLCKLVAITCGSELHNYVKQVVLLPVLNLPTLKLIIY